MEWTKKDGLWVSGPYTIELVEPERWVLTRRVEDGDTTSVEVEGASVEVEENRWTGSSLQVMKSRAEAMEADGNRGRDRNRQLAIASAALMVLVLVWGGSDPITSTLAIAAAAIFIYGLLRAFDLTMRRRPWDRISDQSQ